MVKIRTSELTLNSQLYKKESHVQNICNVFFSKAGKTPVNKKRFFPSVPIVLRAVCQKFSKSNFAIKSFNVYGKGRKKGNFFI